MCPLMKSPYNLNVLDAKSNPIDRFLDFFGRRPGRRLTLKEQFQLCAVGSLRRPLVKDAFIWGAFWSVFEGFNNLFSGTDLRFSQLLLVFAVLTLTALVLGLWLRACGRKYKIEGTY